jgi:zinc transport system permease protein
MEIGEFLGYPFAQRALVAGVFIGIACSLLGVVLVLKRLSLIGDGLAHVTFGSVALGLYLQLQPLYTAVPVVAGASVGIWQLMQRARLGGDAAIGVVSAAGVALGVILASRAGGFNVDLFSYLFGNILAVTKAETLLAALVAGVIGAFMAHQYRSLMALTFDEEFARATGVKTNRLNVVVVILTAITVVLALRLVGVMLTSALLILPAVTSLQLARGFLSTLITAALLATGAVLGGIILAFYQDLPASAAIICVNFLFFFTAILGRWLWSTAGHPGVSPEK